MSRRITALLAATLLALTAPLFAADLPADGGEPGAALLRHFEAIRSGDAERIKSETHPDQHAQLDAVIADGEFEMMVGMMQAFLPENVEVGGGNVDGESAEVNFTGTMDGEAIKGTAKVLMVGTRWLVNDISLSN